LGDRERVEVKKVHIGKSFFPFSVLNTPWINQSINQSINIRLSRHEKMQANKLQDKRDKKNRK